MFVLQRANEVGEMKEGGSLDFLTARSRSHLKNTLQARLCELRERESAGRKRAQVYPLRYSEHVFSRGLGDLIAQRAAAQEILEMASRFKLSVWKRLYQDVGNRKASCGKSGAESSFIELVVEL